MSGGHFNVEDLDFGPTADDLKAKAEAEATGAAGRSADTIYSYTDANGSPLYCVVRTDHADGSKTFAQQRWNGSEYIKGLGDVQPVLFMLPKVAKSDVVWLVEGEKCVYAAMGLGVVATTKSGGAGRAWNDAEVQSFAGKVVFILPDNDKPGEEAAWKAVQALHNVVKSTHIVRLPGLGEKEDIADWFDKGGSAEELELIARNSPAISPADNHLKPKAETYTANHSTGTRQNGEHRPPTRDDIVACLDLIICSSRVEAVEIMLAVKVSGGTFDDFFEWRQRQAIGSTSASDKVMRAKARAAWNGAKPSGKANFGKLLALAREADPSFLTPSVRAENSQRPTYGIFNGSKAGGGSRASSGSAGQQKGSGQGGAASNGSEDAAAGGGGGDGGDGGEESDAAAAEGMPPDIEGIVFAMNGAPISNTANVVAVLHGHPEWAGVIGFDRLAGCHMLLRHMPDASGRKPNHFEPRKLTDADFVAATVWFQRNGFARMGKEAVIDGLYSRSHENSFDPLEEKLRLLHWDGVPRLATWLVDYAGASPSMTQPEAYLTAVGVRWMISAVARGLQPGCKADSALIFVGAQGIGKSTAGRVLAYGKWFSDAMPPLHSKDASDHLRGHWIVELGEMATTSRADVEEAKSFLSRNVEKFRPAYARTEIEYPRRNVFLGTSNRDAFLKDDTGNRRFWPVEVGEIDLARLEAERDLLWAEAVHLFDKGERWHLTREEAALAAEQQASFVIVDERVEVLATRLRGLSETTIIDCLKLLEMGNMRREQLEVGAMLRNLGWQRRHTKQGKKWVPQRPSTTNRGEPSGSQKGHPQARLQDAEDASFG